MKPSRPVEQTREPLRLRPSQGSGGLAVRLVDVRFSYDGATRVIDGASFELEKSLLTGLIGPNGAGKTTLVRLIRGDLEPIAGSIEFGPTEQPSSHRPAIAVVEQHLSLFADMSVAANICLGHWSRGGVRWYSPRTLRSEAGQAVSHLGVDIDLDASVGALPYPSRQMVEIARAIYREADLLILDEPSAGLDARSRQQLLATLKGLVRHGTTVVLVTHDMDDLRGIADKVIEIRDGRVYPFQVDTCLAGSTDAGELPAPGNGSQLNVSVRMPSGQTLRVSGQLGRATVWHFEDALERALTARGLVFCDEPGLCRVDVDGLPIAPPTPQLLREHGIRLLLADRRTNGVFADLTVLQNYLVISGYPKRLIGTGHARELAQQALAKSNVSYPSVRAPVSALSGGNQQRLLWAALAASDSRFIVAEEPLLGLDAQARQAMLNMLREMADSGRGVLVLTCFPRSYPGHEVNAPGRAK